MRQPRSALLVLVPVWLIGLMSGQQPATALDLAGVQVTGARRYTASEVAKLSGLAIGKPTTIADVAAAAERMAATGLFKSVNYRYTTTGQRINVTLEIAEADWTVPVVFDNFVWLPDDQLIAAVRQDVPSFDGTAPSSAGVPELIARSLTVEEGPQFRMGSVEFVGFPTADAEALKKKWRLQPNAVFDESYTDRFYVDDILPAQRRAAPGSRVVTKAKADGGKSVIDLRYVLKSGSHP